MAENPSKKEEKIAKAELLDVMQKVGEKFQLETGEQVDLSQFLVAIYNKLLKIEKAVC